jgi:PTS system mannitol-specific IIC component
MVMPNIGAFIAWGLATAFFIPSGWFPNEKLALLVSPFLRYLLPLLIAYTGGRNVGGPRGGVLGAIAAMGVIVGSDIPMFIGAMAMGPLGGWAIKKIDRAVEGKVAAGFEMLVSNFSLGIVGLFFCLLGFYGIGPVVEVLTGFLGARVEWIMEQGALPLVSVFIEPGKVLFLNNAINHGLLTPLGLEQAQATGSSLLFLLESNPGAGLGVLAAYWAFSKGDMKASAPGAAVIHFLGGIHEIYFPYILIRPVLIIAPILGSASAILVYSFFGGGLVAPASPGSIIAVLAMAPKGHLLVTFLGVLVAGAVSFLVAWPIIRRMSARQGAGNHPEETQPAGVQQIGNTNIQKIIFACDAGMGSSAMGATRFGDKLRKMGINTEVGYSPVDQVPADADVVVCQSALAARARKSAPLAELVVIGNFLHDPALESLTSRLGGDALCGTETTDDILVVENIQLGLESESKEEAIRRAGRLLVQGGYVEQGYVGSMLERESIATTYMGMGVAIPHGTSEAKEKINKTGIVFLQYPQGVGFGEEKAFLVIGLAGKGGQHMEVLAGLATLLDDEAVLQQLTATADQRYVLEVLSN